jgi:hypothetical protein
MMIMLLLWMIGIYSMYLHCHFTMLKRGMDEVIGEHRAIFKLANAMRTQLDQGFKKSDFSVLTEKQLRRRLNKGLNGGSISFRTTVPLGNITNTIDDNISNTYTPISLKTWLKKEKWWLISTVLLVVGVVVGVSGFYRQLALLLVPWELPFIVYVGQSGRSRAVLTFWMFWLFCVRGVMPFMLLVIVNCPVWNSFDCNLPL